jgi:hypothetical protein
MLGALLLGGAAAFLVSCGNSNGLLSATDGSKLSGDLDGVSSAVSAQNCGAAGQRSARLRDDVAALPSTVDSKLLQALSDGAKTVSSQASRACSNPTTTQQTLQTQTQTTTTTPPPTTPTKTTPAPTTPANPPSTETVPPPTGTSPNGGAGPNSGSVGGGAPGSG